MVQICTLASKNGCASYFGMENPYSAPQSSSFTPPNHLGSSGVSPQVVDILRRTKAWVRFIAVIGFIVTAIAGIGSFRILSMLPSGGGAVSLGMFCGALLIILIYFFFAYKLNAYASRINDLLANPQEMTLVAALEAQRGFWKYFGILVLVTICFYVLSALIVPALLR